MNDEYTRGGGAKGDDTHVATTNLLVEWLENRRIVKGPVASVRPDSVNSPYGWLGANGLRRPPSTKADDP